MKLACLFMLAFSLSSLLLLALRVYLSITCILLYRQRGPPSLSFLLVFIFVVPSLSFSASLPPPSLLPLPPSLPPTLPPSLLT